MQRGAEGSGCCLGHDRVLDGLQLVMQGDIVGQELPHIYKLTFLDPSNEAGWNGLEGWRENHSSGLLRWGVRLQLADGEVNGVAEITVEDTPSV